MPESIEELAQNNTINQKLESYNEEKIDKLVDDFMKQNFDKDGCLIAEGKEILNNLRCIGNNEQIYQKASKEFKANIALNLEEFRKTPQDQENEQQLNLINKGIEAEYSYIEQNKFGNKEEVKINKEFDPNNLNTFSKMQLVDLYEKYEGDEKRKKEFVMAIMQNPQELYKDDYLRIALNSIQQDDLLKYYFTQNMYASNGNTPYNKTDENKISESISNALSITGKGIKKFIETGVWIGVNIGELIKKSFEDGEKKEKELIGDFDNKYEVLSKGLKTSEDKDTGFYGTIIQENETGTKTLLIRGSDDWKDWSENNIKIRTKKKLPPQIENVVNFIEEAKTKGIIKPGEKINIVGHSLGGGLAQITSLMYKDIVEKAYTFNAPGIAGIETNIESESTLVKQKVEDYKTQLDTYKKAKIDNPNYEEDFILNVRNKDMVGSFDDENHIGLKSGQLDGFSHFLDSLNVSIKEMSPEEFREKFKVWLEKLQNNI